MLIKMKTRIYAAPAGYFQDCKPPQRNIGSLTPQNPPMQSEYVLDPDRNPDHPKNLTDCFLATKHLKKRLIDRKPGSCTRFNGLFIGP